jgi:hypothetical protein
MRWTPDSCSRPSIGRQLTENQDSPRSKYGGSAEGIGRRPWFFSIFNLSCKFAILTWHCTAYYPIQSSESRIRLNTSAVGCQCIAINTRGRISAELGFPRSRQQALSNISPFVCCRAWREGINILKGKIRGCVGGDRLQTSYSPLRRSHHNLMSSRSFLRG